MKSRILVTGASGFIGSHLCAKLNSSNNEVFGTYHRPLKKEGDKPGYSHKLLKMDLTCADSIQETISKINPTEIYHLAGVTNAQISWKSEVGTLNVNAGGTIRLLEAVRRFSPKASVLVLSSAHVSSGNFGLQKLKVKNRDLWPKSPYGVSKAICELAALNYASSFGLNIFIARSFNHVGVGQRSDFVFADWCRQIAEIETGLREPLICVGDTSLERDFLDVHDALSAYQLILSKGKSGHVYQVASGKTRPLYYFLNALIKYSTKKIKICKDVKRVRRTDVKVFQGDPADIKALGWRSHFSVEKTLLKMLNEWRVRIKS